MSARRDRLASGGRGAVPGNGRGASGVAVWAALLIVWFGWGSTYLGIRVMVETIPPLSGAGFRYLGAAIIIVAWLLARRRARGLVVPRRELASVALVGSLLLVGGNGLLTVAERTVPAGIAALVVASVPLWIVVLRIALRDRPTGMAAAGLAVGFAGVAALTLPGSRPDNVPVDGIMIIVVASFLWALGSLLSARLPMPADAMIGTALEMIIGGVALLLIAALTGESPVDVAEVSLRSALGLGYLITVGSVLAFTAYVWLLQHAPLAQVSTYAFVNPLVALGLGIVLLGERATMGVAIGALLITASVATVVYSGRTRGAP